MINEKIKENILQKGRWGKYRTKESSKSFLYPQEWMKIMDIAKEKQKESLTILINTGARVNEARHIKVEDVDFERNSVVLRITKVRARKGEIKPNPRHIPISSQFSKYLRKIAKKYDLKADSYFSMLTPAAIDYGLKHHTKEIGRKDWQDFSCHNIRKTFECWLIAIGIDGFKVAKHLGHTAQVAMNDYISPDIFTYQDKQIIREILGDLYGYEEKRF